MCNDRVVWLYTAHHKTETRLPPQAQVRIYGLLAGEEPAAF